METELNISFLPFYHRRCPGNYLHFDYCPLICCYPTISADVRYGLHQELVNLGNLQEILNLIDGISYLVLIYAVQLLLAPFPLTINLLYSIQGLNSQLLCHHFHEPIATATADCHGWLHLLRLHVSTVPAATVVALLQLLFIYWRLPYSSTKASPNLFIAVIALLCLVF